MISTNLLGRLVYTFCMNIFKPTTYTWEEMGLFKWSIFLIGIAAGLYFYAELERYMLGILIVGLLLAVYPTVVWIREHA